MRRLPIPLALTLALVGCSRPDAMEGKWSFGTPDAVAQAGTSATITFAKGKVSVGMPGKEGVAMEGTYRIVSPTEVELTIGGDPRRFKKQGDLWLREDRLLAFTR